MPSIFVVMLLKPLACSVLLEYKFVYLSAHSSLLLECRDGAMRRQRDQRCGLLMGSICGNKGSRYSKCLETEMKMRETETMEIVFSIGLTPLVVKPALCLTTSVFSYVYIQYTICYVPVCLIRESTIHIHARAFQKSLSPSSRKENCE